MKKGQIFTVDLMIALAIVVLSIALLTQAWDLHLQQTQSSVEYAKMQQISIDAAALKHYSYPDSYQQLNENPGFVDVSGARYLGYNIYSSVQGDRDCIGSQRGVTGDSGVFVCRKE